MTKGLLLLLAGLSIIARAADPYVATGEEKRQLESKLAELTGRLPDRSHPLFADVDVYRKAAAWILRHPEEFYTKAYVAEALAGLDRGLARADEVAAGKPSWTTRKGWVSHGYLSRVDGSTQPFAVYVPESYDGKPARLDVVLHGKSATLNEVRFLAAHDAPDPKTALPTHLQLEAFGRTNNGYRWSGETDVLEAVDAVRARYAVDPRRIVLRGFSMGGAGVWHLGLHYPDRWAAIEAGAGFNETHRYAELDQLPAHQESALHIYDAVDYARNAVNLPVVGYGGDQDPQLQASVNIREQLARENLAPDALRALFLVGPNIGHKFHPDSKRESDRFIDDALAQASGNPPARVRFVTYTTRYNRCFWATIEELEKHYDRAEIDARQDGDHVSVSTKNVARLRLDAGKTFEIDGERFASGPAHFEKRNGRWKRAGAVDGLRKIHGLQGPVDDAFLDSFLVVRPAGQAVPKSLDRFAAEFAKWLRGDPRIKDDREVTDADIAAHNLILFGDPWNNRLIARVIGKLPIRWTKQEIVVAGKRFAAAGHVPVLIYPNPLNPKRYVVLNSGHTFGEREFRGTNALLFPRIGDYGVLNAAGEVVMSGFFDERWRPATGPESPSP